MLFVEIVSNFVALAIGTNVCNIYFNIEDLFVFWFLFRLHRLLVLPKHNCVFSNFFTYSKRHITQWEQYHQKNLKFPKITRPQSIIQKFF